MAAILIPMSGNQMPDLEWRLAFVDVLAFEEETSLSEDAVPGGFQLYANAFLDEEQQTLTIPVKIEVLEVLADKETGSDDEGTDDDEDDNIVARVEVACVFQFRDLDAARDESGAVQLSRARVASALGIAISTARGVLVGRARHPVFSRVVLPILSPRDQFETLIDPASKPWISER